MTKEEELVEACRVGNLARVKELVAMGVNVHMNHEQALRMSFYGGHFEIVNYLISKGSDIHVFDDHSILPKDRQYLQNRVALENLRGING